MTLGSLLAVLGRSRILWMMLASLAVLAGTVSMVGALFRQANSRDSEPYLAGGVIGLPGGYAVTAAAMPMAATGVLGPLRPTSLASAFFYSTMAALGWAHGLSAASAATRGTPVRAPAHSL
jgi:hypothetical protein